MKKNWVVVDVKPTVFPEFFILNWNIEQCGFGEFTFTHSSTGWRVDTECMKADTIAEVVNHFRTHGGKIPNVDLNRLEDALRKSPDNQECGYLFVEYR